MIGSMIPEEIQETARQTGADAIVYFDEKGNVTIQPDSGREFTIKRPEKKRSRGPAKAAG